MWSVTAAVAVDVIHAMLMAAWVLGLPLLFVRRWPRLTKIYGIYAVAFVLVSRVSHSILGECFLTTVARHFWGGAPALATDEWFTVRVARLVFGMAPSHRIIAWMSEALILLTALGVLSSMRHGRSNAALRGRIRRPCGTPVGRTNRITPTSSASSSAPEQTESRGSP